MHRNRNRGNSNFEVYLHALPLLVHTLTFRFFVLTALSTFFKHRVKGRSPVESENKKHGGFPH